MAAGRALGRQCRRCRVLDQRSIALYLDVLISCVPAITHASPSRLSGCKAVIEGSIFTSRAASAENSLAELERHLHFRGGRRAESEADIESAVLSPNTRLAFSLSALVFAYAGLKLSDHLQDHPKEIPNLREPKA